MADKKLVLLRKLQMQFNQDQKRKGNVVVVGVKRKIKYLHLWDETSIFLQRFFSFISALTRKLLASDMAQVLQFTYLFRLCFSFCACNAVYYCFRLLFKRRICIFAKRDVLYAASLFVFHLVLIYLSYLNPSIVHILREISCKIWKPIYSLNWLKDV